MKNQSLGAASSAVAGILVTGGTNATPIVATITAGHGLKDGDRLAIVGVTGLTAMNGIWTLERVTDTTYKLLGSKGNGTFGGTAIAAVCMDKTPFMQNHSMVAKIGDRPGAAVFVGTVQIQGCNEDTLTTWVDAVAALGAEPIPAATAGIDYAAEVKAYKYMRSICTAYTSGGYNAQLGA
jgi:hypothetical protein